jgi:hypothetical protein
MFKSKLFIISIIAIFFLAIAGCSSNEAKDDHAQHVTKSGDIREETKSKDHLPAFLDEHNQAMKNLYKASAEHKDLLEQIPCYCGCSISANHRDNYDCFVHENKEDGSVVWDNHGTKCQVCLDIAAESINMYEDGVSIKEIRDYIDDKYKEGYPEPTPTPEV